MRFLRHFRWPLVLLLALSLGAFVLAAFQSPPIPATPSPERAMATASLQGGAQVGNNVAQAAACQHSGLAPDLAKQEFGWDSSYLNKKYLKKTLCDDTLLSIATVVCQPARQVFQSIGWPQDLLNAPYDTRVVCTKAHQSATVPPPSSSSSSSGSGPCMLNGFVPWNPINICAIASQVGLALNNSFTQGVKTVADQTETLMESIPAQATYQNPAVIAMWQTMVAAVDTLVGMVILWTGLRYLVSGTNAVEYASVIEVIPRLALTLLVVHFSLTLAQFMIDFTNALCGLVESSFVPTVLIGGNNNVSIFSGFMGMFDALLALLLILQAGLELAGIVVAIPLAPLCLLCLFHPDTQRIARTWISAFGALCLMRFLQVLALTLGEEMLTAGIMRTMPGAEMLNLVLGVGVLAVAAMIPGLLRQWILVPITGGGRMAASAFSTAATYFMIGAS